MLKVHKQQILDGSNPVHLKGVNLGGWLMPEGYIMCAPNRSVRYFREKFARACGEKSLAELEAAFRENYITEKDFAMIAGFGFNVIRLPFHYGLIEKAPFQYCRTGLGYLDRAVRWAKSHGLRVILDMHAVPGGQNCDWHSDSDGKARFWTRPLFQKRAIALWTYLADHYKNDPVIAGYDLLNEPVLDHAAPLNKYYHALIKAIRTVDTNHILFVEGNLWSQDLACLDDFADDNLALSNHFYEPLEFTFNFVPKLKYPLVSSHGRWDKAVMKKRLLAAVGVAQKAGRPVLCGEFGVFSRDGLYGEDRWVADILAHFQTLHVHWTYWTWKAVKNYMFPDGVLSYRENPAWVNRPGPETGWETWHRHWAKNKRAMIASWRTEAFEENEEIGKVLRKELKGKR